MPVTHLAFSHNTPHGALLRGALNGLESGLDALADVIATMNRMIDGDGSLASQFTYLTDKFGFASNDTAKAAWDELNSLNAKLTTDAQVTAVNAALLQAFAKFR